MKSLKITPKQGLFVLALTVLSSLSIYYVSKPSYIGFVVAIVLSALAGFITSQWWGLLPGLVGTSAGFLLLHQVPQEVSKKMRESYESYLAFTSTNFWWMIALAGLVGLLAVVLAKRLNPEAKAATEQAETDGKEAIKLIEKPAMSTQNITMMSMFVALSVVINTMRIGSVSFGGFPIIFSGYVLGPIPGFIVGAVADLVGFIVRPSSFGFNPVFTLTSALTGLIPVVVTRLLGEVYPKYSFIKVLCGTFVGQLLTSVIMVPIFSTLLYSTDKSFAVQFWITASKAGIKQAVSVPVYAFLIVSVIEAISKAIDIKRPQRRKVMPSPKA